MTVKNIKPIIFGQPDISEAEITAVTDVLKSKWLSSGPVVQDFEEQFAKYLGHGVFAVAVSSCTQGLELSLMAMDIGPGDKVIVPTMTFCATVNAILGVGAEPVFIDSTVTGHLNPYMLEEKITQDVVAIVPVHYTGGPCQISEIMAIAKKYNLKVIEDAAHAFGGWGVGEDRAPSVLFPLGTIGDAGCFSFYSTKNITCGEGGMVVTKDKMTAEAIRIMANQGQTDGAWGCQKGAKGRKVITIGRKGNLSDIHASIGLAQLNRWEEIKFKRKMIWDVYEGYFGKKSPGHSMHLFTITTKERDRLRKFLHKEGIGTGIHFNPLHLEPGYKFLGYKKGDFPVAECLGKSVISLPVSSTMAVSDAEFVVEKINEFNKGKKNDN